MKAKEFFDKLPTEPYLFAFYQPEGWVRYCTDVYCPHNCDDESPYYIFMDNDLDVLSVHAEDEVTINELGHLIIIEYDSDKQPLKHHTIVITEAKDINLKDMFQ
jgi:hypothetical protein